MKMNHNRREKHHFSEETTFGEVTVKFVVTWCHLSFQLCHPYQFLEIQIYSEHKIA